MAGGGGARTTGSKSRGVSGDMEEAAFEVASILHGARAWRWVIFPFDVNVLAVVVNSMFFSREQMRERRGEEGIEEAGKTTLRSWQRVVFRHVCC